MYVGKLNVTYVLLEICLNFISALLAIKTIDKTMNSFNWTITQSETESRGTLLLNYYGVSSYIYEFSNRSI